MPEAQPIIPAILRPSQAAKVLGSNAESVRVRMRQDSFKPSIGTACQNRRSKKFTYEIFPERLAAYLNVTVDAVYGRLNAPKESKGVCGSERSGQRKENNDGKGGDGECGNG